MRSKRERGITLVALVITIIIIIILSTVAISFAFGNNGLINRAEDAKEMYANDTAYTEGSISNVESYINDILIGTGGSGEDPEEPELPKPEKPYEDGTLPTAPKLSEGMIPVRYEEGKGWIKTDVTDKKWYNYGIADIEGGAKAKSWANVVLGNANNPVDPEGKALFKADGTLDETSKYSMLVWIPRYAYKVTKGWQSSTAGEVDIVFINEQDKDKTGKTHNAVYNSSNGSYGESGNYVVHLAFNYGNSGENKLTGFWAGKFESSHTGCDTNSMNGEKTYTGNEIMTIRADVTSWRRLTIGNMFTASTELNKAGNKYGLPQDNVVDPHLMKNTEWGAIAFLSKSKYGKETEEVFINNNSNYITGIAGDTESASESTSITNSYKTGKGQKASTNGNVTGIYDMSGGADEYVAGYLEDSTYITDTSSSQYGYGKALIDTVKSGNKRYADLYKVSTAGDTDQNNYTHNVGKYGEAVYETSTSGSGSTSWYADSSYFPNSTGLCFIRGGTCYYTTSPGVFAFTYSNGYVGVGHGFRVVVPVL